MRRRLWTKLWRCEDVFIRIGWILTSPDPRRDLRDPRKKRPFFDTKIRFLPTDPETSPNMSRNGPVSAENDQFEEDP